MEKSKSYFFIVFSLLIWSTYGLILKKIQVNPVVFTFLTAISGCFFITFLVRKKNISIKVPVKTFILLFLITVLFLSNSITFFYAYRLTTIPNAIFSHYLAPVFVAVVAPILLKEKIEPFTIAALVISLAGTAFIFFPEGFKFAMSGKDFAGISLGVVSAVCYALLIVLIKHLISNISYFVVIFYQGAITFIIFLLLFPLLKSHLNFSFKYFGYIFFIGFTHSFLAPVMYLEGLKGVKAQVAGLLGYFEIIGSILIGMIFLKEIPQLLTILGGIMIIFAGGAVIYNEKH